MIRSYEVDAAQLCDALSAVPGVDRVALEFAGKGLGVLRIRLAEGAQGEDVVGAAVAGLRRRFGPQLDAARLRVTGPGGRPVVAVVDGAPQRRATAATARRRSRPSAAERLRAGPAVAERLQAEPTAGRPPGPRESVPPHPVPRSAPRSWPRSVPELVPELVAEPVPEPVPEPELEPKPNGAPQAGGRIAVEDVELVTERSGVRATVRLRTGSGLHAGSASAPATPSGTHRAVVCATASAVEQVAGGRVRLDVEAVDLLPLGPDRVGVVVLTLLHGGRADRVTGSALLREDRSDTLVRATLDALNRSAAVASSAG